MRGGKHVLGTCHAACDVACDAPLSPTHLVLTPNTQPSSPSPPEQTPHAHAHRNPPPSDGLAAGPLVLARRALGSSHRRPTASPCLQCLVEHGWSAAACLIPLTCANRLRRRWSDRRYHCPALARAVQVAPRACALRPTEQSRLVVFETRIWKVKGAERKERVAEMYESEVREA